MSLTATYASKQTNGTGPRPTADEVRTLAGKVRDLQDRVAATVDRPAADPARRAALHLDDLGDLLAGL